MPDNKSMMIRIPKKKGGYRPGAGRKKGSGNKITMDVRQMILNALESAGGEDYLVRQARKSPALFLMLVSKIVPQKLDVGGQKDNPILLAPAKETQDKAALLIDRATERMNQLKIIENAEIVN